VELAAVTELLLGAAMALGALVGFVACLIVLFYVMTGEDDANG